MRTFGWVVAIAGLIWAIVGAENIFTDCVVGWRTHNPELAARSFRENGLFYDVPGLSAAAIGAVIARWANRRQSWDE